MGFLDFLKKDKAAPPLPKPVGFSNAELEDIGKRIGAPAGRNAPGKLFDGMRQA